MRLIVKDTKLLKKYGFDEYATHDGYFQRIAFKDFFTVWLEVKNSELKLTLEFDDVPFEEPNVLDEDINEYYKKISDKFYCEHENNEVNIPINIIVTLIIDGVVEVKGDE